MTPSVPVNQTPSVPVQVADFKAHLTELGLAEATIRAYGSDIRSLLDYLPPLLGGEEWHRLVRQHVNNLRDEGKSPASVTRAMTAIRAYRIYLSLEGVYHQDPFVGYRGPRRKRATPHPLPGGKSDVEAMLRACHRPSHRLLVALCGLAGLRVAEARSVTPRSLLERPDGWWLSILGKGGVYREVPVSDELLQIILMSVDPHHPPDALYVDLSDRGARKAITDVGERAGISREVASHDLRHTFGSDVYARTKDLRVTQELLGHASSSTTEVYTGVSQSAMRNAL